MSSDPGDSTVRVIRVLVRTAQAFPPTDPISVPLLRLMAATNDVRQLQVLLAVARDPAASPAGRAEQVVHEGELLYYIRLFFGHLYEAGRAFRGLDDAQSVWVTRACGGGAQGKTALGRVRAVFADTTSQGFYQGTLGAVRNLVAFHYKDATFQEGLSELAVDAELVVAEWAGFSRYGVTDAILKRKVVEAVGGTKGALQAAVAKALGLASALETVVATLARAMLDTRALAIVGQYDETLPVPDLLQAEARARRVARGLQDRRREGR